jgi:hypothetical protein
MKKIFVLFALLLLAQPLFALTASIQPPRFILRGEAPGTVGSSVNVINPNNESITIGTDVIGDIENMTTLSDNQFLLGPNETRTVNFTIDVAEAGDYAGEILFFFTPEQGQGAALSSQIVVLAEAGTDAGVDGTETEDNWLMTGALVVLAFVVIVLIYWGTRK